MPTVQGLCLIFCFIMHQTFSVWDRSRLQAGQSGTWTLLLWSHAFGTRAENVFALSCWNKLGRLWKRLVCRMVESFVDVTNCLDWQQCSKVFPSPCRILNANMWLQNSWTFNGGFQPCLLHIEVSLDLFWNSQISAVLCWEVFLNCSTMNLKPSVLVNDWAFSVTFY